MKYNKERNVYLAYRNIFGSGNIDVYTTYGPLCLVDFMSSNQKRRVRREWKEAWENYCADWRGSDEV